MARSYKRDKNGRFASTGGSGKVGKSAKNTGARAEYKAAARQTRVAAGMSSRATDKVGAGKRLAAARTAQLKTELKLGGKKKELAALNRAEAKSRKIETKMAAQKAVAKGKEKAAKTFRGKVAAVKRSLFGKKKK